MPKYKDSVKDPMRDCIQELQTIKDRRISIEEFIEDLEYGWYGNEK